MFPKVKEAWQNMTEDIIIKNHKIGNGKPLICVPVTEQSQEGIIVAAREIAAGSADMLEWRMDYYENVMVWEETRHVLSELSGICKDIILLCTFRSRQQGGERDITEEDYRGLLLQMAESGYADIVDVEVRQLSDAEDIIWHLHSYPVRVLASQHYFSYTPETKEMEVELSEMKETGADISKLAVMPMENTDVIHLLEATAEVKKKYPDYPFATMAMGGMGMISRLGGQIFGSCITFAMIGKSSAPGQLPLEDVSRILEKISESME